MNKPHAYPYEKWLQADREVYQALLDLFKQEPLAEASLIHRLSSKIPPYSKVYLGNSLPIREWDQAAVYDARLFKIGCNRGVNGIDGQLATFLGFCSSEQENWSILGDLTLLYDLAAPWVMSQLTDISVKVVVVNNGGAGIFARMFSHPAFQNNHHLTFEPLAKFWNWRYEAWDAIPDYIPRGGGACLIELKPDNEATQRFHQKYSGIL